MAARREVIGIDQRTTTVRFEILRFPFQSSFTDNTETPFELHKALRVERERGFWEGEPGGPYSYRAPS